MFPVVCCVGGSQDRERYFGPGDAWVDLNKEYKYHGTIRLDASSLEW